MRYRKIFTENECLSPDSDKLSPEENQDLSTSYNNSGDTGYIGDKSDQVMEDNDKEYDADDDSNVNKNCNCQDPIDPRIRFNHPFYYCKEHPKVQNIHLESISHHLEFSKDHKSP